MTMDDAIVRLTTTAVGKLEQNQVLAELSYVEWEEDFDGYIRLAGCTLERVPGKNNWIEEEGGLPEYICEVARSIHRGGKSVSRSIAIAVGQIKNWAHGKGEVNADTRAKAAAALAQWTRMKAARKAK
jgi:hypothetical protein